MITTPNYLVKSDNFLGGNIFKISAKITAPPQTLKDLH